MVALTEDVVEEVAVVVVRLKPLLQSGPTLITHRDDGSDRMFAAPEPDQTLTSRRYSR